MPTAQRYYLIADDGKIHRLARSTFYKLLEQKIPLRFPSSTASASSSQL